MENETLNYKPAEKLFIDQTKTNKTTQYKMKILNVT